MNTHKIIEIVLTGVAEYYGTTWRMLLPKNVRLKHLFPHARAIVVYILDKQFGRHFVADLLLLPKGTVSTLKTKSREIIAFDIPLQEFLTDIENKINKVR